MSFEPLPVGSGGGGGGGAVTIADGANVSQGAVADAAYSGSGNGTLVALGKKIVAQLAGTLTASISGAIPAGANTIGNVGIVSSSVHTAYSSDSILAYDGADKVLYNGTLYAVASAAIAASSSGANSIVSASANLSILVLDFWLSASGTVNAKWQSASTDKTGLLYGIANVGISSNYNPKGKFVCAVNEALNLNLSGAVAVGGGVTYAKVA